MRGLGKVFQVSETIGTQVLDETLSPKNPVPRTWCLGMVLRPEFEGKSAISREKEASRHQNPSGIQKRKSQHTVDGGISAQLKSEEVPYEL